VDKLYREIWERACKEGKGGFEDGRPWVESCYHLAPYPCKECVSFPLDRQPLHCFECSSVDPGGKDFFWPANEPLPKEGD
jgi:hypothetical protein